MKKKNDVPLIVGMIIIFIGTLLPAIKIASENISFFKDNGPITVILVAIMFVLFKLEKKQFIFIPSLISIAVIIKFITENATRLKQINEIYNCYAEYQYGLIVMLVGNLIILLSLIINLLDFVKLKEKIEKIEMKKIKEKTNKIRLNINKLTQSVLTKIKKQKEKIITHETTKDGKIKFNKIIIKCDNKDTKNKTNIKRKINDIILKFKLKKISKNKLSITKFDNNYKNTIEQKTKKTNSYKIPVIDIKKWTRNEVCCINCGATVSTNSEYCFLCDCKMKLSDKKEKMS